MTLLELKAVLDTSGVPFAYLKWETEKKPPFGVYLFAYDTQFYADGALYYSTGHYQVELYTAAKTPGAEAAVEQALADAKIAYTKAEYYLESEKLYEILYEIEV